MAVYAHRDSTKGHLLKLSLRLQQEVAGKGVRVQVVLPGATRRPSGKRPARTSRLYHQTS
jgi:short-subunit dehydrogenase